MMKLSSGMSLASFSVCLHLFLLSTLIFPPCKANSSLGNDTDYLSLLKFKESISDDPHHILDSWNTSTHFCNWHGIICGHKHRRVKGLMLEGYDLGGSITPHIGNLSFLRALELENNKLHGEISQDLGRLFRLRLLDLSNNKLHGEIPQDLGRLFQLRILELSNNTLIGKFPVNITSCSKLSYLSFSGNNLTGKIPMEIGYLHSLEKLYLFKNNFSGQIPMSTWNLSSLDRLELWLNNLEGSIPEAIGRLKNLTVFGVSCNMLSGAIPSALYNLSSLVDIELALNQFNGSFPTNMFSKLPNLMGLYLGGNQFSGHIPTSITNATMLEEISIGTNNFVGKIPNLGKLYGLSFLEFANNNLGSNSSKDWEFLDSLNNCSELTKLVMDENNLGGHLPNTIGSLSIQLTQLKMGQNQIYGTIPLALGNLINLIYLDMEMNYLTGVIPITFANFRKMQMLSLPRNKLSGEIHFIGNLTRLFDLDLSDNMLEGSIPPNIGNCKSLQFFELSKNNFSGAIPVQLVTRSSLLILLNMSHNSFGGDIPYEVGNLKNIGKLDVSHNQFSGKIPQTIGDCQSLEYLFLQRNFFQETIPLPLASLKGLRHLDLSQNNLSGSIPKGLEDITFLEYLNVSFNMLDGQIPSKGVFANASAISLMGNNKLCGGISVLKLPPCPIKPIGQRKHQNFKLIISICCVIAFLLLTSIVATYHGRKRSKKSSSSSPTIDMISRVSYQSLHSATNGFSINNLIGSGSFGSVYKGSFESNEVVAIKVINLHRRGANKSFVAECNALRNTRHRNMVKIKSCCSSIDYQGQEFKALVYQYMVNGSLENWLYPRRESPDHHPRVLLLDQIINILTDVASVLRYLHHECEQPLVHCDLKPSNVLLDGNMIAHLSDFGLARLLSTVEVVSNEQSSTIGIKGTIGYVPPEYGMGSEASIQGDMYSFGILILEILTKRRPTEDMFKDGHDLHQYVESVFPNNLLHVVSPTILPIESEHEAASRDLQENMVRIHPNVEKCLCRLFRIGLACSMESPNERMSAADVTRELISIKMFFPLW